MGFVVCCLDCCVCRVLGLDFNLRLEWLLADCLALVWWLWSFWFARFYCLNLAVVFVVRCCGWIGFYSGFCVLGFGFDGWLGLLVLYGGLVCLWVACLAVCVCFCVFALLVLLVRF